MRRIRGVAADRVALAALAVAACGGGSSDRIKVAGVVEVDQVVLGAPVRAQVVEMRVEEGDRVSAGQVLAVLDQPTVSGQVPVLRAQLEAARARLRELEAGVRPEELRQLGAAVKQAESRLAQAERDLERGRRLAERRVIGRAEAERLETQRDLAAQSLSQAREQYRLAERGARRETVEAARAQVGAAEAALALAEELAHRLEVRAPWDGVVQTRSVEPGATVAPSAPLYQIGRLDRPYLLAYLPERFVGRVSPGSAAEIAVDAYPGRTFAGRVRRIASQAEFTPRVAQTEEQRADLVFEIRISLDDGAGALLPGMPADAFIRLDAAGEAVAGGR